MADLTDADKVLRNDVGKSIVSKLDDIADAIVQHGGGAESLGQLSDVNIDTTTLAEGQSIVYNETTQKFENGQVSTVGGLNDLDDVTLTNVTNKQELVYDDNADVFKNKTTRIELTQAQYDALVTPDPDVDYYITDAPSMTGTSQELSYDGGTDSTYDVIEEVKDDVGDLSTAIDTITTYSTSEAVVGKWTDGRLVYQRVFEGLNITTTADAWVDTGVARGSIKKIIGGFALDAEQCFICSFGFSSGTILINMPIARTALNSIVIRYVKAI